MLLYKDVSFFITVSEQLGNQFTASTSKSNMPFVFPHSDVSTDYFTDNNASGGEGGSSFTFIKIDKGAVLKKIKAWKDDWRITGVEVWMTDDSSRLVGTRSGSLAEFSFQSGENITKLNIQASGPYSSVAKRRRLGAIWFQTNKNRDWGIFSRNLPEDGRFWPEVGSGICCGIFGNSGDDVDRLGFAMLREVKRSILTNVTYPNLAREIVATTPDTVAHQVFSNNTAIEQTFELSGSKSVTITREWGLSTTLSYSHTVEVKAGIPEVASAGSSSTWSVSGTASFSQSSTTSETKSWTWPLVCPPGRRILGEATMYADNIDTEYEADMELHLVNGKVYRYKEKGSYNGLNARTGNVTVTDLGPFGGK
ncbi:hypothetical protein DPMN_031971 [Dreissena polymorpha]|uniref:Jacalin-type lectin domain-containing protein n=1 Tax=Dreissena polymorpha TaxID=45954 RepID=A0A9D4RJL3_DREPO|nr:hypothetical protein DPMN_031971 [Dreissena polymorpha]